MNFITVYKFVIRNLHNFKVDFLLLLNSLPSLYTLVFETVRFIIFVPLKVHQYSF